MCVCVCVFTVCYAGGRAAAGTCVCVCVCMCMCALMYVSTSTHTHTHTQTHTHTHTRTLTHTHTHTRCCAGGRAAAGTHGARISPAPLVPHRSRYERSCSKASHVSASPPNCPRPLAAEPTGIYLYILIHILVLMYTYTYICWLPRQQVYTCTCTYSYTHVYEYVYICFPKRPGLPVQQGGDRKRLLGGVHTLRVGGLDGSVREERTLKRAAQACLCVSYNFYVTHITTRVRV